MIFTSIPLIKIHIESLTSQLKREHFQALWELLQTQQTREQGSPKWHGKALRERLEREARGESFWDDVGESFDQNHQQITQGH